MSYWRKAEVPITKNPVILLLKLFPLLLTSFLCLTRHEVIWCLIIAIRMQRVQYYLRIFPKSRKFTQFDKNILSRDACTRSLLRNSTLCGTRLHQVDLESPRERTKFCHKCGKEFVSNELFYRRCGTLKRLEQKNDLEAGASGSSSRKIHVSRNSNIVASS